MKATRLRSVFDNLTSYEVLALFTARLVGGLFGAIVGGLFGYFLAWFFVLQSTASFAVYVTTVILAIGLMAGAGAVLAWWNTESPRALKWAYVAATLSGSAVSALIAYLYLWGEPHYTWVPGVGMVPVMELGQMLYPTMVCTVIASNLVAGSFYLYRAALRREV